MLKLFSMLGYLSGIQTALRFSKKRPMQFDRYVNDFLPITGDFAYGPLSSTLLDVLFHGDGLVVSSS